MAVQKVSIWRQTPQLVLSALLIATVAVPLGCRPRNGTGNTDLKVINHFRSSTYKSLDPPKQFDVASAEIIANVYGPHCWNITTSDAPTNWLLTS